MLRKNLGILLALCITFALSTHIFSQNLKITTDPATGEFLAGQALNLNAQLENFTPADPSFLHTWVDATGFRKLKLGNNPDNIYGPKLDVATTENTHISITMRVRDDLSDWKKMLIRPNGIANSIKLSNYVPAEIQINQWFTFQIPLVDFDNLIEFTQLFNLEFPYSGGANHFNWDIYSIIFTGGSNPFIWMGPGHLNNANNGNGGPGEVFAEWNNTGAGELQIPEIRLFANGSLVNTQKGLAVDFTLSPEAGTLQLLFEAWDKQTLISSASLELQITDPGVPEIGISLLTPSENQQFEFQELVSVSTEITGNLDFGPDYLQVKGLPDGWRKLKIGNNASSLYSPAVNVTSSGNTHLEIIMKDADGTVDWSKIELRPNGVSSNPIGMSYYWSQREILEADWVRVRIPLYAFDPSIDFSKLINMEFPYSKGAGSFNLQIQDIRFTGGSTDFIWFGENKTNNLHDGLGNPGQLLAELIQADQGGFTHIQADLILDNQLFGSDLTAPFSWNIENLTSGGHEMKVILQLDGQSIISQLVTFRVLDPVFNIPKINLSPGYDLGIIPVGTGFTVSGSLSNLVPGENFQCDLLRNNEVIASSTEANFSFPIRFPQAGSQEWSLRVLTQSGVEVLEGPHAITAINPAFSSQLSIANPQEAANVTIQSELSISSTYTQLEAEEIPYLEILNPGTGYRKLKLGNNARNMYSPKLDVISTGNTHMDITLKLIEGTPALSKIIICPQEITTGAPKLSDYWDQAEDLGNGWKKLHIPLADFDAAIDFTSIGYLAFPYSKDAGDFKFGLREIAFTGSTTEVLYFGQNHLDNITDGYGNPGQLLATLVEAGQAPQPEFYYYFMDGAFIGTTASADSKLGWIAESLGSHQLVCYGFMPDGTLVQSAAVQFSVLEPVPENESIVLKLRFDQASEVSITKSRLRYNKSFAYSLTLDDGLDDAYGNAFKVLSGGYVAGNATTYPGLFFTDGCGNDVPFTAGLAWYSVNGNYSDLHLNTPSYITWNQLIEMYNAGWDVLNHSYSHSNDETTDHYFQIDENQKIVLEKTGINMTQFVIPGGNVDVSPYIEAAQNYGLHTIYAHKSNFTGYPTGIQTDGTQSWENMTIYRDYNYDSKYTSANITDRIDLISSEASTDRHIWFNDFTHRVLFGEKAGSLQFETFEYYMNHLSQNYGKSGTDELWMASLQQVWEYLYVRDHTTILTEWIGNELIVTIDISNIPADLRSKALSLNIQTDGNYQLEVSTSGVEFSSNTSRGLINLAWDLEAPLLKKGQLESLSENKQFLTVNCYPNPIEEDFLARINCPESGNHQLLIYDLKGTVRYEEKLNLPAGESTAALSKSGTGLIPGIYFVEIRNKTTRTTQKIVVK